jgi:small subunit ribosomal protein S19
MARSLKKGPFIDQNLLKKVQKGTPDDSTPIKTWARHSTLCPEMIGFTMSVYNGKSFINVKVSEDMIGHKLGEFAPTTRFVRHGGKMQRDIEGKAGAKSAAPAKEVKAKK